MQSLNNVIKRSNIINLGNKEVITSFQNNYAEKKRPKIEIPEIGIQTEDFEKAGDKIIEEAKAEADRIYKEAYEKGYKLGFKKGKEDGNLAAENSNKAAMDKIQGIYNKAVLDCSNYLKDKENDIKKLIVNIARKVLKKDLEFSDGLNNLIISSLNEEKSCNVLIRCNEKYSSSLKNKVEDWKRETGNKTDVFIMEDVNLKEHKAILEKDDGKAILDLDKDMDNIEKIILGEPI